MPRPKCVVCGRSEKPQTTGPFTAGGRCSRHANCTRKAAGARRRKYSVAGYSKRVAAGTLKNKVVEARMSKYGVGLFAGKAIAKGNYITQYTGKLRHRDDLQKGRDVRYFVNVRGTNMVLDGKCIRNLLRFDFESSRFVFKNKYERHAGLGVGCLANHASSKWNAKLAWHQPANAGASTPCTVAYLEASRDIKAGFRLYSIK